MSVGPAHTADQPIMFTKITNFTAIMMLPSLTHGRRRLHAQSEFNSTVLTNLHKANKTRDIKILILIANVHTTLELFDFMSFCRSGLPLRAGIKCDGLSKEYTLGITNMNTVKASGVKLSRSGTTSSNEELFTRNISYTLCYQFLRVVKAPTSFPGKKRLFRTFSSMMDINCEKQH